MAETPYPFIKVTIVEQYRVMVSPEVYLSSSHTKKSTEFGGMSINDCTTNRTVW